MWLCNIPRGQFIRLKRNCMSEDDFLKESHELSSKFQQKGYEKTTLNQEIEKTMLMDRNLLVSNQVRENSSTQDNFKFILGYNVHYKKI